MNVLIKGMQMPESCDVCSISTKTQENGYSWGLIPFACPLVDQYIEKDMIYERRTDCPLVELEDNRLYGVVDGVVYVANLEIPKSKTLKIPPIEFLNEPPEQ